MPAHACTCQVESPHWYMSSRKGPDVTSGYQDHHQLNQLGTKTTGGYLKGVCRKHLPLFHRFCQEEGDKIPHKQRSTATRTWILIHIHVDEP